MGKVLDRVKWVGLCCSMAQLSRDGTEAKSSKKVSLTPPKNHIYSFLYARLGCNSWNSSSSVCFYPGRSRVLVGKKKGTLSWELERLVSLPNPCSKGKQQDKERHITKLARCLFFFTKTNFPNMAHMDFHWSAFVIVLPALKWDLQAL